MTPQLRKVLKSVSAKNQGLQEILKSCKEAIEVVSVDKTVFMLHNTRIVLKMPNDEQRVQFYNRVDIASFINAELDIPSDSAQAAITHLNSVQGCDFTEDDLEIVDGWLQAKASSLGYTGKVELPVTKLLPATIPNNVFIAMYMDASKAELSQAAFQGITLSIDGVKVGMQDSSIQLKLRGKTYVPSPPPNNPELKPLIDVPFPIPAPPKEGMVLLSVIQSSNITDARLDCQWDFSVGNESGVLAMVPFGDNPSIAFKGIEKQFSYKLTPLAPI